MTEGGRLPLNNIGPCRLTSHDSPARYCFVGIARQDGAESFLLRLHGDASPTVMETALNQKSYSEKAVLDTLPPIHPRPEPGILRRYTTQWRELAGAETITTNDLCSALHRGPKKPRPSHPKRVHVAG